MSAHSVFVLDINGNPLTPTTPRRARMLMKAGQAKPTWSRFSTFGIQMLVETRKEVPDTVLGIDHGTKFEGYSVVVAEENPLNIKLDLPDKKKIVKKIEERRNLRRARRHRNCRMRPARFDNRKRNGFIAPSQLVIINSRLKIIREFFKIYPIKFVGYEDVKFNHSKKKWGANFSTIEIGKTKIKEEIKSLGSQVFEYSGYQTSQLRKKYNYKKSLDKSLDSFESHCCDSLSLAIDVIVGNRVTPGQFLVIDDTYRPVRRRLHDTQFSKGGVRDNYSKGTVFSLRKGILIQDSKGRIGQLCGEIKGNYRYYHNKKRLSCKKINWFSNHFVRKGYDSPAS